MPVLPLRIWPDPALTSRAAPVTEFNEAVKRLVGDLFATMYDEAGIGLAANQVGVLQRVLVVDLDPKRERDQDPEVDAELRADNFEGPVALINPRIVASSGKIKWEEGCLSVPGISEVVERKAEVTVEALDPDGKPVTVRASGLFAVCLQHEMDHLDGRVFVEYLSQLKRDVIRRKMVRQYGEPGATKKRAAG